MDGSGSVAMELSMSDTKKAAETDTAGFSKAEKAAMKERARELKAEARASKKREEGERAVLEKIAEMPPPDRAMAERLHAIVSEAASELWPRTWYGMPAYARDGKVVCFFQGAAKFEARYATFGFNDAANLDDGHMWPTAFALVELTDAEESRIAELVRRAAG
jgi:uncharacterized protein YdhG (YjbR/CyaY superfamily)